MSILDFKGKQATAGLPVLYQLVTGQLFYSEAVQEDGDSFVFDSDRTLLLNVVQGSGNGSVTLNMAKLSAAGFASKQTRVLKTAVVMVQDVGKQEIIDKAHEALSGLVLPKGALPAERR